MFEIKKKNWKEKNQLIGKIDILNGLDYSEVSDIQQMLYHAFNKLELLEKKINELENKLKIKV